MAKKTKLEETKTILESGEFILVPTHIVDTFLGINEDGDFLYREKKGAFAGQIMGRTGCCGAFAKGSDGGIACRVCYQEIDPRLGGELSERDIYIKVKK